ncbi:hypothetical protein LTR28_001669, partial [Elasticomyces elasticus]
SQARFHQQHLGQRWRRQQHSNLHLPTRPKTHNPSKQPSAPPQPPPTTSPSPEAP